MNNLRGDRFGGVIFDIQQHRSGGAIPVPQDATRAVQREKLIHMISTMISMVEDIDAAELREDAGEANPRIGTLNSKVLDARIMIDEWIKKYGHLGRNLHILTPHDRAILADCIEQVLT